MRISYWSSDVCSSDLSQPPRQFRHLQTRWNEHEVQTLSLHRLHHARIDRGQLPGEDIGDRKSVVQGKSVSVRVDLGGRRLITKNKEHAHLRTAPQYIRCSQHNIQEADIGTIKK